MRWTGWVLALIGLIWAVWAVRALGTARCLGRTAGPLLIVRGPYRRVRHPMYFGVLCLLCGLLLATGSRIICGLSIGAAAFVAVVIPIEERRLIARCGEAYRRYRCAVPAVFPFPGTRRAP